MISLLCPTRGRPESMKRFVSEARQHAAESEKIDIVFRLDADDLESLEVGRQLGVQLRVGPRAALSSYWNDCAQYALGDIMGLMGDDIVFQTWGWDHIVREAFGMSSDKILYVHGRDGVQGSNLGTHGFLSRKWVETVGRFGPPYFTCDYIDRWITDVADMVGRRVYLEELYTEHLHPCVGKAEIDQTHQERLKRGEEQNPAVVYASLLHEREAEAQRLRGVMA